MIGETVGNYRVLQQIGEGGMGVVYLAEHTVIGKKAALKMLLPAYCKNEAIVTRFFNEARATAKIQHPGLIEIYDFGHHADGSAYIVMEFLDGESLAALLKRSGPLELQLVIELSRQIAGALLVAHAEGIVHRDLKPDNVFLIRSEELKCGLRAKVLDFGIAKLIDQASNSQMKTRTGVLMGTPAYMSPEQCRGASRVDHRADIYSLGCMMFEMASGKSPFVAEGLGEVIAAHLYEPVPPLTVTPQLDPVAQRALAKKVEERYQDMAELLADLDALLMRRPIAPRPTTGANRTIDETLTVPRSSGRAAAFALAGVLAVSAAGGLYFWRSRPAAPPPPVAQVATTAPLPAPTPAPAPPPPLAPPQTRVSLTVESVPTGAQVYRAADGVHVGKTPFTTQIERGEGEAQFILKLAGYRDATVSLPIDHDGDQTLVLTRGSAAPSRVSSKTPPTKIPPSKTVAKTPAPEPKTDPVPEPKAASAPKSRSLQSGELHSPF